MRIVCLYGPPAAGKLTVARALEALTGFAVLHNHLTVELARALFPFGSEAYLRYLRELRLHALHVAAREGVPGVITTFAYTPPRSDEFLREVLRVTEELGASVHFVRLAPSEAALRERVVREDRKAWGKATDPALLQWYLTEGRATEAVSCAPSFTLDNTLLSPDEAAGVIAAHLGLPARS